MKKKKVRSFKRYILGKRRPRFALPEHPFIVPVITFLLLFFLTGAMFIHLGGETVGAPDSRVVRFSLDGDVRVVPTRAKTVAELLERLDVTVTEDDIVEPGLDTQIFENDFSVNVYKAKPVTIIDEKSEKRTTLLTAQPTAKLIVEKAGIRLNPEDRVELELAEDTLKEGAFGPTVVIERAEQVYVNLYGNPIAYRTHANNVAEVLKEKGIEPLPDDTVRPAPETAFTPGMQIYVIPVGKDIVSREEAIPAPLEVVEDPNANVGTEVVRQEGSPGVRLVTVIVDIANPDGENAQTVQSVVAVEPVTRIVARGTKVVYSNPSENVELGRQIAASMGYSDQFSCIYSIFQRESKWNHLAQNRSSGAYGIPQALPGSKMGPGWQTDPAVQIRWGIGYMVNRYGSPCGAQRFWEVNHWY